MKGSPEVIKTLQAALAQEAHLNVQYRHDWRIVKFMGVKKVACKIKDLGDDAHCFMKKVADQVLFLGGGTSYSMGPITDQPSLTAVFENQLKLEMAIIEPYEQAVQTAMQALDDTTRNLFEHLLKWHQEHVGWLEQQLQLIQTVGGEAEYIAEKL